jgi:hypothetical protein
VRPFVHLHRDELPELEPLGFGHSILSLFLPEIAAPRAVRVRQREAGRSGWRLRYHVPEHGIAHIRAETVAQRKLAVVTGGLQCSN